MATRIRGDVTIDNDATVTENLTVDGTSTTLNTATLDVEDVNITVNSGGDQATADGAAGITVEMSDATNATIIYDSSTTSKFKAGESGSEVEVATISAAQVLTNKDIDGGTASNSNRITVPKASKSTLDGLTRKEATLVYASDEAKMYVDDGTELQAVGSGGGGLDVFHTEDFESTSASDFVTGNATDPDGAGTGTLDGTLADETGSPIAGTTSLEYTHSTSSTDDFFLSPEITVDEKQTNNWIGVTFYYTYDGDDEDMRFVLIDDNDNELTDSTYTLEASTTAKRFSAAVYIPDGVASVRWGLQVATGNSGSIILVDDFEMSTNPFVYKDLVETQWYRISQAGNALTNRATEVEFNLGTATISNEGATLLTASDDSGNTRTKFTCNRNNVSVYINWSAVLDASGQVPRIYLNGTELTNGSQSSGATSVTSSLNLKMDKDDYITVGSSSDIANLSNSVYLDFIAFAETEHVVHHEAGTENTFSALIDNNGSTASITSQSSPNSPAIASVNRTGTGVVDVTFTTDFFGVIPAIVATPINTSGAPRMASISALSTTGCTIDIHNETNGDNEADQDFMITLTRQGTDYKNPQAFAITPLTQTAYVKDVKSSGTAGGTFTSGAWQTRDLNTLEGDTGFISLSSNQFTLQPGKYEIEAFAPASTVDLHQAKLYNITDSSDEIIGQAGYERNGSNDADSTSIIKGQVTITSSKTFEIQHRCSTTGTTIGFGRAGSFGVGEVYTQVKITKVK